MADNNLAGDARRAGKEVPSWWAAMTKPGQQKHNQKFVKASDENKGSQGGNDKDKKPTNAFFAKQKTLDEELFGVDVGAETRKSEREAKEAKRKAALEKAAAKRQADQAKRIERAREVVGSATIEYTGTAKAADAKKTIAALRKRNAGVSVSSGSSTNENSKTSAVQAKQRDLGDIADMIFKKSRANKSDTEVTKNTTVKSDIQPSKMVEEAILARVLSNDKKTIASRTKKVSKEIKQCEDIPSIFGGQAMESDAENEDVAITAPKRKTTTAKQTALRSLGSKRALADLFASDDEEEIPVKRARAESAVSKEAEDKEA